MERFEFLTYAVAALILIIGQGWAVWSILCKRQWWNRDSAAVVRVIDWYLAAGALGYLLWGVFFVNPLLGRGCVVWVFLLTVYQAWKWRDHTSLKRNSHFLTPGGVAQIALVLFGYGFWLAAGYISGDWSVLPSHRFFETGGDNYLPRDLTNLLWSGSSLSGDFHSGYQTSDRPPLQSGLYLLAYLPTLLGASRGLLSQMVGMTVQLIWLPASLYLAQVLGLKRRSLLVLALIFSGFFIFNSIYVWPKLLAGGLYVIAIAEALSLKGKQGVQRRTGLARIGLCLAFAYLSHGGIIFSFLGTAVAAAAFGKWPRWKEASVLLVAVVLAIFPWIIFQKWVVPPGDALVRAHFTSNAPELPRGIFQAIISSYEKIGFSNALTNKLENVLTLARTTSQTARSQPFGWLNKLRHAQYYSLLWTCGFMLAGALGLGAFVRNQKSFATSQNVKFVGAAIVATVVAWCLLMFNPGATVVHQGTYGVVVLVFLLLHGGLTALPYQLHRGLVSAQFLLSIFVWLPLSDGRLVSLSSFLAVACLVVAVSMTRTLATDD